MPDPVSFGWDSTWRRLDTLLSLADGAAGVRASDTADRNIAITRAAIAARKFPSFRLSTSRHGSEFRLDYETKRGAADGA
jgi:hypothetical protein